MKPADLSVAFFRRMFVIAAARRATGEMITGLILRPSLLGPPAPAPAR